MPRSAKQRHHRQHRFTVTVLQREGNVYVQRNYAVQAANEHEAVRNLGMKLRTRHPEGVKLQRVYSGSAAAKDDMSKEVLVLDSAEERRLRGGQPYMAEDYEV
jgi:hypothetical protein